MSGILPDNVGAWASAKEPWRRAVYALVNRSWADPNAFDNLQQLAVELTNEHKQLVDFISALYVGNLEVIATAYDKLPEDVRQSVESNPAYHEASDFHLLR